MVLSWERDVSRRRDRRLISCCCLDAFAQSSPGEAGGQLPGTVSAVTDGSGGG